MSCERSMPAMQQAYAVPSTAPPSYVPYEQTPMRCMELQMQEFRQEMHAAQEQAREAQETAEQARKKADKARDKARKKAQAAIRIQSVK